MMFFQASPGFPPLVSHSTPADDRTGYETPCFWHCQMAPLPDQWPLKLAPAIRIQSLNSTPNQTGVDLFVPGDRHQQTFFRRIPYLLLTLHFSFFSLRRFATSPTSVAFRQIKPAEYLPERLLVGPMVRPLVANSPLDPVPHKPRRPPPSFLTCC